MRRTIPVAMVCAGLVAATGCAGDSAGPSAGGPPPVLVRVAQAQRTDVPFIVRAPGLVVASETVASDRNAGGMDAHRSRLRQARAENRTITLLHPPLDSPRT